MRKKAVAQGLVGFILGAIVSAVLLANEPQLLGDVRSGMHDLRLGAKHVISDRDDTRSSDRRYDDRDRDWRDDRNGRDRYDSDRPPGDSSASP